MTIWLSRLFKFADSETKALVADYIELYGITEGKAVFPNVTDFFSKFHKEILSEYEDIGSTNVFRHMIANKALEGKVYDTRARIDLADMLMHSPEMSVKYLNERIKKGSKKN